MIYRVVIQGYIHRGDPVAPKFSDTLTLFQPRGADSAHPLLQDPPKFFHLPASLKNGALKPFANNTFCVF